MHDAGAARGPGGRTSSTWSRCSRRSAIPCGCRSCGSSPRPTARSRATRSRLPVAKSTGSHHLKVLREAGVVTAQVDGTRKYHTLRRADLDARFPGLLDSVLHPGA